MNWFQKQAYKPFFIKLFNWEYWSFNTVYAPIIPIFLLLCARARSFFFFSAANPGIENGGFLMESKKKIYAIMPEGSFPATISFKAGVAGSDALQAIKDGGLDFPIIAKPDIGARGRGVRKLQTVADLSKYCSDSPLDFMVQEYIPYPLEAGIFYCRMPGAQTGRITGIVSKEFLSITGTGTHSIRQLLEQEKRFILQLPTLETIYGKTLEDIPAQGEIRELVPYGNHARGAKFLDASDQADAALHKQMDLICRNIPGFYYGRLDIRFCTWETLKSGKDFSVIELNGSGSEPTHIYDPRHSIFFAWKEIIRHWLILFRISRIQHKSGIPYMSFTEGRKMFRDNAAFEKMIEVIHV